MKSEHIAPGAYIGHNSSAHKQNLNIVKFVTVLES